ncbi:uncharacterized protein LOC111056194 isoform X2 [Nilaparvata lugens]|uniref:uncharacterized protein LOC111056194 isoform X2 n=1 Tax=Nilaparvata lugens TaxID=108931 RepID=UPI00193D59A3|nr:uncharacterized protein LOC111056194 isoform X2 [Nilaparvata lugens]
MARGNGILMLIELVSESPILYDTRFKDFNNKGKRLQKWIEVCEKLYSSWNTSSEEEKALKMQFVRKRWKNLRTCYQREMSELQRVGHVRGKRRSYLYFDQLSFLAPVVNEKIAAKVCCDGLNKNIGKKSSDRDQDGPKEVEVCSDDNNDSDEAYIEVVQTTKLSSPKSNAIRTSSENNKNSDIASVKTINKNRKLSSNYERLSAAFSKSDETFEDIDKIDEDKSFLLSLVPSFRKMTDSQKMNAKMGILSVMATTLGMSVEKSNCTNCK